MTRRPVLTGSLGIAASTASFLPFLVPRYDHDRRPAHSRVAILLATQYSEKLASVLWEGLKLFKLDVTGRSVLLKANLVDYIPEAEINTHPLLIAAAAECFRRLGAKSIAVTTSARSCIKGRTCVILSPWLHSRRDLTQWSSRN